MSEENKNAGQRPEQKEQKKKFKMPSAYVIVFAALIITVILTYFVPVSVVDPETGSVVYDATFDGDTIVVGTGAQPMGLWDILLAPIKGFQSASNVGIALLMAGGFLSVLNATGALEAGIGRLLKRLKGGFLVAIMLFVFAMLGTVFGFWEEITAFALVVVPMFVMAGYDVMTGILILFLGATIGNMASIVNPFATGAAVAAIGNPELTLGSGILLRALIFAALYVLGTVFVMKYAASVKADKEKSVLHDVEGIKTLVDSGEEMPELTGKRKVSVAVFILIVVLLLIGYIPWEAIGGEGVYNAVNAPFRWLASVPVLGDILGAGHITPFGDWGFDEFSFLFFFGALLLLVVNRMKIQDFLDKFLAGAKDILGVVIVLAIARGIAVVMGDASSGMSVTFVYWISNGLASAPLWIFGVVATAAYVVIGIFLQSTSGVAGISMPILGAVAAALFGASAIGRGGGQIILISAFTVGLNFMTAIYPGATTLGTLELFNVPYDKYLKLMLKYSIPLLILGALIVSVAPYIGLA